MDLNAVFARSIRKIREDNDFTRRQVAQRAQLSVKYIAKIEQGVHNPRVETILKLCKGLKISPSELFFEIADLISILEMDKNSE